MAAAGSFQDLIPVSILRKQLDNKVDMLVQLTELAFVLLLERLHPRLNMLIANALGSVVFQRSNRFSTQKLTDLAGGILLFSFALGTTLIVNRQPLRLARL